MDQLKTVEEQVRIMQFSPTVAPYLQFLPDKFAVDFFARGLHTRIAVARLPLHQLGFLVIPVLPIAVYHY